MKKKNNSLLFLPLGGSGEIGMNCNIYNYKKSWIMVDLGVTFGDSLMSPNELIMPKLDFFEDNDVKLDALILTHAHEDHIGAVPYLHDFLRNVPIFTTSFTASVLKRKLQSNNIYDLDINLLDYNNKKKIGCFEIELLAMTHSIPEPNGIILSTKDHKVFHTGDWKLDPSPLIGSPIDEEKMKFIGNEGVDLLVCDSTNIFDDNPSGSEEEVRKSFRNIFSQKKEGKIIVTCFASNVARLETIIKIADEFNKVCVFLGRSIHKIYDSAIENNYLKELKNIIKEKDSKAVSEDDLVLICTGSQGEPNAALSNLVNNRNNNISLSKNDLIIFSSREIPGNEKRINILKEKVMRRGCQIFDQNNSMVHVSGHPSKQELRKMYEWINPNIIIPVHGEYRHLLEHKQFAKKNGIKHQIIVQNGELFSLDSDSNYEIIDRVAHGRNMLKGNQLLSVDHQIFENLKILNTDGELFINLILSVEDKIIHDPVIHTSTISLDNDSTRDLKSLITQETLTVLKNCIDDNVLKIDLEKKVRNFLKKKIGLKPSTHFEIIRI